MEAPAELERQAEVLEAQAIELETQGRPVAAQARLQQAKSRRDHATALRQQSGEPQKCVSEVGTVDWLHSSSSKAATAVYLVLAASRLLPVLQRFFCAG